MSSQSAMDTYYGHVRTPADAIKLFEACRLGVLPRVQRRLSEKERQSIKSGSVFVWDEREAGMRRWTDGKSWSASRVSGSFLTYREMEGKRGGGGFVQPPIRSRGDGKSPDSGRNSDEDLDMDGDGPDGYRYKPDGLMKQSFSITTSNGQHLHLISYYSRPHPGVPELPQPTSDPSLRHITPQKGMYPESTAHEAQGPAVTRTPMQQGPYMQPPHPHMQPQPHHRGPPPPYGYQVAPGYGNGWPPSPVSTPPYHYQGPMYAPGLPPPGSVHSSPYQHLSPHQSNSPYHHHSPHQPNGMPHYQMMHHPYPPQSAYDRPPPPIADPSLTPQPLQLSRGMSNATAQNIMPVYAPNPSPRVAQGRMIAEQSAQLAQRVLQSGSMLDPRLAAPPTLPPVQLGSQHNTLPPVQILSPINVTPRTTTPPQSLRLQLSTPTSTTRPASPKVTPTTTRASQAQVIPSISSLVHAEDSVSVIEDNKNSSRQGSKSPRASEVRPAETGAQLPKDTLSTDKLDTLGANKVAIRALDSSLAAVEAGDNQQPKDIPHEKLHNMATDVRAIRSLDRSFCL